MTATQTYPASRPVRAASQRPGHGRYPSMRPSGSGGWDEGLQRAGSAGHRLGPPEFRHSPAGSAVPADTVAVALTAEHARSMHYSIPMLLSLVRRQLANRRNQSGVVVELDLKAVPPIPMCAPLLRLITLLLQAAGRASEVVVTGVSPALGAGLIADLPDRVVVVDQAGRRWPG
jgi:hypothetical protein